MWIRLRQIALLTADLGGVVEHLRAVFGLEVGFSDPAMGRLGLENRLLPVGSQFFEVITPRNSDTTQARFLSRWGDTGYMVICQAGDVEWPRQRVAELSLRVVGGSTEVVDGRHRITQIHPKDTGGSFLEIDWHVDGDAPVPPWEHGAGFDWQNAIRTHRVRSIVGVEMQTGDPEAAANRWSEILQLPSALSATGRWTIELENAAVHFVKGSDPRGDGISAVELGVVDRRAVVAAAAARGLVDPSGALRVCGIRFDLHAGV